jgi:hypothetical protein
MYVYIEDEYQLCQYWAKPIAQGMGMSTELESSSEDREQGEDYPMTTHSTFHLLLFISGSLCFDGSQNT